MVFKNKAFNKFWRISCSFQLGIPILVALAVLVASGTIIESQYGDAYAAKKFIYDSWMMWLTMGLLVYNLTVVVIDRWPWKLHHYPFIVVHAGIIILVMGGYVTNRFGLDGQMSVPVSGKNNYVSVSNTDIVVYATYDGDRYTKIYDREVDFFKSGPSDSKPFEIQFGDDKIQVIDYARYALLQTKVKASQDVNAGASVKIQLTNANVKQVQQITQAKKGKETFFNLGPLQVALGDLPQARQLGKNQIIITPVDTENVKYALFKKEDTSLTAKPFKSGLAKIGSVVDTGWMGLQLRLLDYIQLASEEYDITKLERSTPMTMSAIKIRHKSLERWLALNDIVKIFGDASAYLLSFQNRRLDLGFHVFLNQFDITRYQGTMRAMQYASRVSVFKGQSALGAQAAMAFDEPDAKAIISMNEPMKFDGYTIYQASFQEDEMGKPVASVFSVNKDPGRPIKYLGSIILSFGIVWLFYQRRKKATSA